MAQLTEVTVNDVHRFVGTERTYFKLDVTADFVTQGDIGNGLPVTAIKDAASNQSVISKVVEVSPGFDDDDDTGHLLAIKQGAELGEDEIIVLDSAGAPEDVTKTLRFSVLGY